MRPRPPGTTVAFGVLAAWAVLGWGAAVRAGECRVGSADGGVLDMACWDGERVVALGGTWRFRFGDHRLPRGGAADGWEVRQVPGPWGEYTAMFDGPIPRTGRATYWLSLRFAEAPSELYLHPGLCRTACRVLVRARDGDYHPVFESARLERLGAGDGGRYFRGPVALPPLGPDVDLVYHVQNGFHVFGGIGETPSIGAREASLFAYTSRLGWGSAVVGAFLIMALFNLALWLGARELREYLYLGIAALVTSLQRFEAGGVALAATPHLSIEATNVIGWTGVFGMVGAWVLYMHRLFPHEVHRWAVRLGVAGSGIGLALTWLTPPEVYLVYGVLYRYALVPFLSYLLVAMGLALWRNRPGSRALIASCALGLSLALLELAFYNRGYPIPFDLSSLGAVGFLAMQSLYVSVKFRQSLVLGEFALKDALTSLANRRSMTLSIEREGPRAQRSAMPYSIVIGDIDRFKALNDRFGHAAGDAVLVSVARTLRAGLRKQDGVARWGGEEFLLLLPETPLSGAKQIAHKLCEAIRENRVDFEGSELSITMTFGVAEAGLDEDGESVIRRADLALYEGKAAGRDRVVAAAPPELEASAAS